jgi:hypothetical protein
MPIILGSHIMYVCMYICTYVPCSLVMHNFLVIWDINWKFSLFSPLYVYMQSQLITCINFQSCLDRLTGCVCSFNKMN